MKSFQIKHLPTLELYWGQGPPVMGQSSSRDRDSGHGHGHREWPCPPCLQLPAPHACWYAVLWSLHTSTICPIELKMDCTGNLFLDKELSRGHHPAPCLLPPSLTLYTGIRGSGGTPWPRIYSLYLTPVWLHINNSPIAGIKYFAKHFVWPPWHKKNSWK